MAGVDNLTPFTVEKAREMGSLGGAASGEAKRKKKLLRELINEALEKNHPEKTDENGNPLTYAATIAIKAVEEAAKGDWKALELVRDTAGQKPVDKIMIADVDADVLADVERLVEESESDA